ncbi:hypothetical protein [Levilactobacillus humaensis]|uniref:hypothetical protein n=1 Tax=Levilactobacillus humaensis TaxID=2950375 RepID=UPI0021C453E3|nr:hypothetical protein [Levilactobacillus humaensis]
MYVAGLLNWTQEEFLDATPNYWMKSYILWLQVNNPDAVQQPEQVKEVSIDQIPFF